MLLVATVYMHPADVHGPKLIDPSIADTEPMPVTLMARVTLAVAG